MRKILVTGGAGFIGSHFIRFLHKERPSWEILNVDKLTYAGDLSNLKEIETKSQYRFVQGDICDVDFVNKIISEFLPNYVVNFAAESHVDRSIEGPLVFVHTNVMGTQILLEASKKMMGNNDFRYLQVSTDEVYGALGTEGFFTEETPLAPNSPYSASKASADLLVRSYIKTYKFPAIITRCSNNYGPNQYPEKLVPVMVKACINGEKMPVYGDGKQVRDWLYVEDHCSALLAALEKGDIGEVYNIGGGTEISNIEMVQQIIIASQDYYNRRNQPKRAEKIGEHLITFVPDRLGHDWRYAINNAKIQKSLGWSPKMSFEEGLSSTVEWYIKKFDQGTSEY